MGVCVGFGYWVGMVWCVVEVTFGMVWVRDAAAVIDGLCCGDDFEVCVC